MKSRLALFRKTFSAYTASIHAFSPQNGKNEFSWIFIFVVKPFVIGFPIGTITLFDAQSEFLCKETNGIVSKLYINALILQCFLISFIICLL